jgi:hypothetical protein
MRKHGLLAGYLFWSLFSLVVFSRSAVAQSDEWTWMSGSSMVPSCLATLEKCGQPGVYGTLKTPASTNTPGGREYAATWRDSNNNLWLFGGVGYDSAAKEGTLNDLWIFSPATNQWTWMGGSDSVSSGNSGAAPGVYGIMGTPAPANIPGARQQAASWTDNNGNL